MTDASLPPLIQQMLQPEFYPHPVASPIDLIQTHVSYVLMTGDYVYKLKKPVNFGFLDFSTLAQREHFCHEELRLNQRGAADLYLDVVPVSQTEAGYALSGDNPVEYAVKMKQFPQNTLLTDLFDRGELTEELVRQLAVQIANFHKISPTTDYIRSFGKVERVRQAFDENYEQTVGYIGGPQTQQQFDETRAYTDHFFADREALFAQRIERNCIRECHGDLHLRNIAYWNGDFLLFDCIEFNEPFRFVDVMYDVAYIVMDLDMRQRTDLRMAFLNTYIEEMGDWEGLQVLPIYVNRQTYVRAKVISFLLSDPSASAADKQAAHATAAQYYKLAWEYTQPQTGRLLVMAGLSGSGKTTIARTLAGRMGAVHIRSDAVRKHLAGISIHERGDASLYTPEMTQKTYSRLLELGVTLATEGYTVVLDAKYDRQEFRAEAIAQAQAHHLPLDLLYCSAPHEVLCDRLQHRSGDIADATVEVLAQQHFEPFVEEEQPLVTTLDTTQGLALQLDQFLQRIPAS